MRSYYTYTSPASLIHSNLFIIYYYNNAGNLRPSYLGRGPRLVQGIIEGRLVRLQRVLSTEETEQEQQGELNTVPTSPRYMEMIEQVT